MTGSNDIKVLVIGYGNEWRGDDGVGPAVAEQMDALGLQHVDTLCVQQLTPDLAEPISSAARVVFIDASGECESRITVRQISPNPSAELMTHVASPCGLLAVSELLFGRSPEVWLVTIEGKDFSPGEGLSDFTKALLEEAVRRVSELVRPIEWKAVSR